MQLTPGPLKGEEGQHGNGKAYNIGNFCGGGVCLFSVWLLVAVVFGGKHLGALEGRTQKGKGKALMASRAQNIRKRKTSRRVNYLKSVIAVQDIVREYGRPGKGYSQKWVFDNIIAPNPLLNISYGTFCNYLGVAGARTELRELTAAPSGSPKGEDKNQLASKTN